MTVLATLIPMADCSKAPSQLSNLTDVSYLLNLSMLISYHSNYQTNALVLKSYQSGTLVLISYHSNYQTNAVVLKSYQCGTLVLRSYTTLLLWYCPTSRLHLAAVWGLACSNDGRGYADGGTAPLNPWQVQPSQTGSTWRVWPRGAEQMRSKTVWPKQFDTEHCKSKQMNSGNIHKTAINLTASIVPYQSQKLMIRSLDFQRLTFMMLQSSHKSKIFPLWLQNTLQWYSSHSGNEQCFHCDYKTPFNDSPVIAKTRNIPVVIAKHTRVILQSSQKPEIFPLWL